MRTISGAIVLTMFSVILFSSCQKEIDWEFPNQTLNDSTAIQKVIVVDTTEPVGIDTVFTFNISYDAGKRISKNIVNTYNSGVSSTPVFRDVYNYKYTGTNNNPDFIIHDYKDFTDPSNDYTDTTYFTYSNGFVATDSTTDPAFYSVTKFTKLSDTRYKMLQYGPGLFGGLYIDTTYSSTVWQNGNLINEVDSLWINSLGFWDVSTVSIGYDSKPNPFKNLIVPYPIPANSDLVSFALNILSYATTNNIVFYLDDTGDYTLSYKYGTNGLPQIAKDPDGLKILYYYTKL